jgi:hypothetical protein
LITVQCSPPARRPYARADDAAPALRKGRTAVKELLDKCWPSDRSALAAQGRIG